MENSIKESLTCGICQEVATLPVHGTCCSNANKVQPACLLCVRKYLGLNEKYDKRTVKKAWGGCGCNIYPNTRCPKYLHSEQLYQIRDIIGDSECYNCYKKCTTSSELRRHLDGTATDIDKNGNCLEAYVKCKYCSFFGKRKIVNKEHYYANHVKIFCDTCKLYIPITHVKSHYEQHVRELNIFRERFEKYNNINENKK